MNENIKVDEVGLPVPETNRRIYARKNGRCDCTGTGELRYVVMNGKVAVENGKKIKNPDRDLVTCHCVNRRYTRLRKEIDKRLEQGLLADSTKTREELLPDIVKSLGF